MYQRDVAFANHCAFARGQVDGMPHQGAFAGQAKLVVHVQVVAGGRKQVANPGDFFDLFGQMRLHQAVGVFRPKAAQRL